MSWHCCGCGASVPEQGSACPNGCHGPVECPHPFVSDKPSLVREFQEWLNERRDAHVSQVFHEIVHWVESHLPKETQ